MTSRGPEPAALRRRAPEPVVVVKPISDRGSHAGVVWFLSEQENRFLLRYQEWDYLDGAHPAAEDVFYLVADESKQRFGGLGVQARRSLVGDSTADSEVGFCIGSRSPTGISRGVRGRGVGESPRGKDYSNRQSRHWCPSSEDRWRGSPNE